MNDIQRYSPKSCVYLVNENQGLFIPNNLICKVFLKDKKEPFWILKVYSEWVKAFELNIEEINNQTFKRIDETEEQVLKKVLIDQLFSVAKEQQNQELLIKIDKKCNNKQAKITTNIFTFNVEKGDKC